MSAYTTRMPAGSPGDVTRLNGSILEPGFVGDVDVAHGAPVKLSGGKFIALEEGDTAADVYGVMSRSFPQQGGTGTLTPDVVPAGAVGDVLRTGYILVLLAVGTAVKGGAVYVRTAAAEGKALGDIEATLDISIAGEAGENTGNATIGGLAVADAAPGDYSVVFTGATAFNVFDPDGRIVGSGATGSEFNAAGIAFTITAGGTPCVAGDEFTVTVSVGNVAVPAKFMGEADANGGVEISYNI